MKLLIARSCIAALALSASLVACATYDDSVMQQACTDSQSVKDLPPQVAARESKCRSLEVWSSNPSKDDKPIDFSGKKN